MKRERSLIKKTKADRVAGPVPNQKPTRLSNNAQKRAMKRNAIKVSEQGVNPRKKYACTRKRVNMVNHAPTGVPKKAVQIRRKATIAA